MPNFSQKVPAFKRGSALPADSLNHVVEAVKRMIVKGAGIEIKSVGDQIVISATGQPIPRIGGSGGGGVETQYWEIAESKAELSLEVERWVLGLVQNDGATAEDGRRYYLSADGSAWICWTHLE